MKELIKSVSEDLAESILSETLIDANLIHVKIESALKVLISRSKKPSSVNMQFMTDKLSERNKQARIDAIEKNFWKTVAKTYVGENHIKEYYERLNLMLKNEEL